MKKRVLVSILAAAALIIATAVAAAAQSEAGEAATGPQPKMVIESLSFDAGNIIPGTLLQHEFVIKNQGTADLELRDVRPSCGCTVASYDKLIAPGAEGRVLLKIRIYREWAGQDISKSAWVLSNDPDWPQSALIVNGRVLALGMDGNKPPLISRPGGEQS